MSAAAQQQVEHAPETGTVRRVEQACTVQAGLPEHRLQMRERAEAGLAVITAHAGGAAAAERKRSEEPRVGTVCVRQCRSRWSPPHAHNTSTLTAYPSSNQKQ